MPDSQEDDNRSLDDIEWAGGGGLTVTDVRDAVDSGPLLFPEVGDVGFLLDEPGGTRAVGVSYGTISAPDVTELDARGILRREHLFTATALDFLQRCPSADFRMSVDCFLDDAEGWWGVVRTVGLASGAEIDPTTLAAFAEAFSRKVDGSPIAQSLMIMLHNAQSSRYAEAFDFRAQTLADLPRAHLMPFPTS